MIEKEENLMDTAVRLAELIAEFRVRSEAKHRAAGLAGHAEVVYHAPRMAWLAEHGRLTYRLAPQYWEIVYIDGQGRGTRGAFLGNTRAKVIMHLLGQRAAFP